MDVSLRLHRTRRRLRRRADARPRRDARAREPRDRSPRARLGARDHPSPLCLASRTRLGVPSTQSGVPLGRRVRLRRVIPRRVRPRDVPSIATPRARVRPRRRYRCVSSRRCLPPPAPRVPVAVPPRSGFEASALTSSRSRPPSSPSSPRRRGDPTPLLRWRGAEPAPEPPGGRRGGHRGGPRERSADRPAHLLRNQLERAQLNATFVDRLRPRVASGDIAYLQRIVLTVDANVWDDELYFWKNAMGMRVTRETPTARASPSGRRRSAPADGGKSRRRTPPRTPGRARQLGNGLAHISLRVPYGVRVSRIYESGGELCTAFRIL